MAAIPGVYVNIVGSISLITFAERSSAVRGHHPWSKCPLVGLQAQSLRDTPRNYGHSCVAGAGQLWSCREQPLKS